MQSCLSPTHMGATLYTPANHQDLSDIIFGNKIPGLRSLVICLEDALNECDIPEAYRNIERLTSEMAKASDRKGPDVFIRPRSTAMAVHLIEQFDLSGVAGFVLPKFTIGVVEVWWGIIENTHLLVMPTLETKEVFDAGEMGALASLLEGHAMKERIPALRIGGNDLMSLLSMRRSRTLTIYDSPLGYTIKMLATVFGSRGFSLTAPVCELIADDSILNKELELDAAHGLVGKTAIHPGQVSLIEGAFVVDSGDLMDALRILNSSQAVFSSQGAMCEPATHRTWAQATVTKHAFAGSADLHATDVRTNDMKVSHSHA